MICPARLGALCSLLTLVAGCGGGLYGYSRDYSPLDAEEPLLAQATKLTYEEVKRSPGDFRETMIEWFGVVTSIEDGPDGAALVHLTYRAHQARHLCYDETAGSCRVTVSDRPGGAFSAVLTVRDEDKAGEGKLWAGSLLRVYGRPSPEPDAEGAPVIVTEWYRHWPTRTYVTTASAGSMRR